MKRMALAVPAVLVAIVALVVVSGATAKKPALSATPVFKLNLKGSQEVPPNKDQKGSARGTVTFDLTRNSAGTITSGDVIFSFNYSFASPTTVSGLHHPGRGARRAASRSVRCCREQWPTRTAWRTSPPS